MADILAAGTDAARDALRGAHVAFGVFDGVHAGHRFLIGKALARAAARGGVTTVLTFDIDPDELFCADRLMKLLPNGERLAMLAETGVDAVCVLHFDRDFASLPPEGFLESTFGGALPASVHVGRDIRFGSHALGTLRELEQWGSARGVEVFGYDLLTAQGEPITATRIRSLLAAGDDAQAHQLLGR